MNIDSTHSLQPIATLLQQTHSRMGRERAKGADHSPQTASSDVGTDRKDALEPAGRETLTADERKELQRLQARDREVRAHEAAHKSAAGGYARGSVQFEFVVGPDGRRYASGGEVSIDTSKVHGDPQATLRKAQVIRRAANAPVQPSSQDRRVAAEASRLEAEARQELAQETLGSETSTDRVNAGALDPSNAIASEPANTANEATPVGDPIKRRVNGAAAKYTALGEYGSEAARSVSGVIVDLLA